MNIVILDDYQDAVRKLRCVEKIESYNTKIYTNNAKGISQLIVRLKDADVVILSHARTQISRQVLEKLTRLKLIIQIGRIGSHLDVNACHDQGITIVEGEDPCDAVAEFTWALIMSTMRRIPQYTGILKHGGWQQSGLKQTSMPPNFALGTTLKNKVLGVWGFGGIGSLVAGYGQAFGMKVLVWGSEDSRKKAIAAGFQAATTQEELFKTSDILTIHLRLSPNNRHIIRLAHLLQMKPTALFVNTAHAELVDTQALVSALNRGTPGMAAIDVYDSEPILQGHALLRLENAICTPHIGCVDKESTERHYCAAFNHLINFHEGKPLPVFTPERLIA